MPVHVVPQIDSTSSSPFIRSHSPLMSAPSDSSASTMQAYAFSAPGQAALKQVDNPKLSAPLDVLVRVHAVATNPVDSKALMKDPTPRTVGYDASGVIVDVGSEAAKQFAVGQEVFYAGQLTRDGSFAEWQLVDSRFIAKKPASLSHADAAAFPLVSLTAYEALHETMRIQSGRSILILPGAGGVGSIAIQLAKQAGLRVIATASREDTKAWAIKMGADAVIDHTKGLADQWKAQGLAPVNYIFSTHHDADLVQFPAIIAPRGHIVSINGNADIPVATVSAFFVKRVSLSWEMMFSRGLFGYEQDEQGRILSRIAGWIDEQKLQSLISGPTQRFKGLASMEQAFALQSSGKAIGKIVVELM